jgi:hypothetical protein
MAFNEFYVDVLGNDLNAGSTTATTAAVTQTNGNWSTTTNIFTPVSGTPFSAVSIGDWASVYLDAAVTLVYLAQVTAVNGGGATVTLSTTAKYGTAPVTGATGRSCKIGGAWATAFAFIGTGTTAVYTSTRINIKTGGYNDGTNSRNWNNAGSATAPLIWRGYNTTPGDIDANNSLVKPIISWGNAVTVQWSGTKQQFANLDLQISRSGNAGFTMADEIYFTRCRFENSNAGGTGCVQVAGNAGTLFQYCWFKGASAQTRVLSIQTPSGYSHCVITGGQIGAEISTTPYYLDHVIFLNQGSHGVSVTSTGVRQHIVHCSFKGCAGDGIRYGAGFPPAGPTTIRWCLFDSVVGTAINNANANVQTVLLGDNDFYNCGANFAGLGDTPTWFTLTESSNPAVSSSDPTFSATTFNGASVRQPFENVSISGGFYDVGAAQRQVTAGGGGSGTAILAGAGIGLVGGV